MQLDEKTRSKVFTTLEAKLGETAAVAIMNVVGFDWGQMATKTDLARLEAKLYRALFLQTFALLSANFGLIHYLAR